MMLNYKVFFVSDANACRTDEEHNATLAIMMIMFADVRSTDEMIALLQRHATPVVDAAALPIIWDADFLYGAGAPLRVRTPTSCARSMSARFSRSPIRHQPPSRS